MIDSSIFNTKDSWITDLMRKLKIKNNYFYRNYENEERQRIFRLNLEKIIIENYLKKA